MWNYTNTKQIEPRSLCGEKQGVITDLECSHFDSFFFFGLDQKKDLPNIQNWAKCAHCMLCVHMVAFLLTRAYKMHKGVKTAPGIPQLHTQVKISCKEMGF